jgi:hypothetical protein
MIELFLSSVLQFVNALTIFCFNSLAPQIGTMCFLCDETSAAYISGYLDLTPILTATGKGLQLTCQSPTMLLASFKWGCPKLSLLIAPCQLFFRPGSGPRWEGRPPRAHKFWGAKNI